jgi:hypothetical protein
MIKDPKIGENYYLVAENRSDIYIVQCIKFNDDRGYSNYKIGIPIYKWIKSLTESKTYPIGIEHPYNEDYLYKINSRSEHMIIGRVLG